MVTTNYLILDLVAMPYGYQKGPHESFPPLKPKKARQNRPAISFVVIYRWRSAWRREMGGRQLGEHEKRKV